MKQSKLRRWMERLILETSIAMFWDFHIGKRISIWYIYFALFLFLFLFWKRNTIYYEMQPSLIICLYNFGRLYSKSYIHPLFTFMVIHYTDTM
jgi:hypothetical protein